MIMNHIVFLWMLLFIQGCTYAISPGLVEKADKTITFEMLQTDPDAYKGAIVILGGTINQVTNLVQGAMIDVSEKRLDYWGKPISSNKTGGRFYIYAPQYLDPGRYSPGRTITVAGEVMGTKLKKISNVDISHFTTSELPVLIARELKLWQRMRSPEEPEWWDPLSDKGAVPHQ
jgi:outer membrane lipoprotein